MLALSGRAWAWAQAPAQLASHRVQHPAPSPSSSNTTRWRQQCWAGGRQAAGRLPVAVAALADEQPQEWEPAASSTSSASSIGSGAGSPAQSVQRALGLDYGRRVVGLAASTLGFAPRPLEGLPGCTVDTQAELAEEVLEVARREGCDAVVVGLPVTQAGSLRKRDTDSQQGRHCRNFALNLAAAAAAEAEAAAGGSRGAPIRVFLADERGSTMEALQQLASSGRRKAAHGKVRRSAMRRARARCGLPRRCPAAACP